MNTQSNTIANFPILAVDKNHPCYPQHFRHLPDMPKILYVRCRDESCLSLLNARSIAVIGTRKPTDLGLLTAESVARVLCTAGYTIVSGLALGIDTAAHRGALNAAKRLQEQGKDPSTGRTIAVLARIDRISPTENLGLALEILRDDGLLISEHAPGTKFADYGKKPEPGEFYYPKELSRRDRIQAALASLVIPVQTAHWKRDKEGQVTNNLAGTMHTVTYAHQYQVPIAIPTSGKTKGDKQVNPLQYEGLDWIKQQGWGKHFLVANWETELADLLCPPQQPEPEPVLPSSPEFIVGEHLLFPHFTKEEREHYDQLREDAEENAQSGDPDMALALEAEMQDILDQVKARITASADPEPVSVDPHKRTLLRYCTTQEQKRYEELVTLQHEARIRGDHQQAVSVAQETINLINATHLRALGRPVKEELEEFYLISYTKEELQTEALPHPMVSLNLILSQQNPFYRKLLLFLSQHLDPEVLAATAAIHQRHEEVIRQR